MPRPVLRLLVATACACAPLLSAEVRPVGGAAVLAGQRVVTAGSDGRLPHGLVLGTVTAATRSPTAGHWHVEVAPLREADSADSLLMLKFASAPPR